MPNSFFKRCLLAAVVASFVSCAFAEDAPVYDVDTFPQFEGQQPDNVGAPPPPQDQQGFRPVTGAAPSDSMGSEPDQPMQASPSTQGMSSSQRLARLEQQMNNLQSSDSSAKMADMQSQLQTLRGQMDQLSHQLQEMQTQQKKYFADIDKRLARKSAATASSMSPVAADDTSANDLAAGADTATKPAPAAKPAAIGGQPNVAEEQKIYQTAYNLIKVKKYNEAATTLQSMLQKYPSGQFAGNAHYWLGQLYSLMGKNDQAATEFGIVVKNYPDYPKLSDAQLKLGLAYASLLKWSEAKSAFKKVINTFPGTTSAHLASEQLKQIKVAGH